MPTKSARITHLRPRFHCRECQTSRLDGKVCPQEDICLENTFNIISASIGPQGWSGLKGPLLRQMRLSLQACMPATGTTEAFTGNRKRIMNWVRSWQLRHAGETCCSRYAVLPGYNTPTTVPHVALTGPTVIGWDEVIISFGRGSTS